MWVVKELFDYIEDILNDEPNISADKGILNDFKSLQECGYMLPSVIEKIVHPASKNAELLLERRMGMITLQVTQQCNLRCKYCIYSEDKNLSQRSHSDNVMTWEIAKSAIDFLYAHSIEADDISIGFYGGEPLLAFPLIKKIVVYADEIFAGKDRIYSITTNGTLISDEVAHYLNEHKFRVAFSIDGPKEAQNKNRIFRDGSGTYDIVVKNIEKLYRCASSLNASEYFSINSVISPDQEYTGLKEMFSNPIIDRLTFQSTFIEEDDHIIQPSAKFLEDFDYDVFLECYKHFRHLDNSSNSKHALQEIDSLISDLRRFSDTSVAPVSAPSGPCIPGKLRLFVNCFGDMYPCERVNESEAMKIGSIGEGINLKKVVELLNVGQLSEGKCKKCFAFSLCGLCAKYADYGDRLDGAKKKTACEQTRKSAYVTIRNKILNYENYRHVQDLYRTPSDGCK